MALTWLVLLWWLFHVIQLFQNSKEFTDPSRTANWSVLQFVERTALQFLFGGVAAAFWLKFVLKRPLHPRNVEINSVIIMVFGHLAGSLTVNLAYAKHTWHMLGVVRGWEPVVMFVLLVLYGHQETYDLNSLVLLGVLMMATGLSVFMTWYVKLNTWGMTVAVLSTTVWPLRNVYLKSFGEAWDDPLQKYAIISIYGFLVLLPAALARLVYSRKFPFLKSEMLWQCPIFQVANSCISLFVLERISPLFHAVLGTTIRMSVAMVTVCYLQVRLSWCMFTGLMLFAFGLTLHNAMAVAHREQHLGKTIRSVILAICVIFSGYILFDFMSHSSVINAQIIQFGRFRMKVDAAQIRSNASLVNKPDNFQIPLQSKQGVGLNDTHNSQLKWIRSYPTMQSNKSRNIQLIRSDRPIVSPNTVGTKPIVHSDNLRSSLSDQSSTIQSNRSGIMFETARPIPSSISPHFLLNLQRIVQSSTSRHSLIRTQTVNLFNPAMHVPSTNSRISQLNQKPVVQSNIARTTAGASIVESNSSRSAHVDGTGAIQSTALEHASTLQPNIPPNTMEIMLPLQLNISSLIQTFWVYTHPPPDDILLNIQTIQAKGRTRNIHVHCATFRCMERIRQLANPRVSASFLALSKVVRDSPLEQWFSRHALHKLLSGKSFEDHLHEAVRLALPWHYGGIYLDPFLKIQDLSFQEFDTKRPWVSSSEKNRSHRILDFCNFPPRHAFLGRLVNEFVTQYSTMTYLTDNSKEFVSKFHNASSKVLSLFCEEKKDQCPKVHSVKSSTTIVRNNNNMRHFGVMSEILTMKNGSALEYFVSGQFFPFVDVFLGNKDHEQSIYYNTTAFVSSVLQDNKSAPLFPEIADSVISSLRIDFQKRPSPKQIQLLRHREPIGCRDTKTVEFLRNNNITAYYFAITSLLVQSQFSSRIPRNSVYLVDVQENVKQFLPIHIQGNGITLKFLDIYKFKFNWHESIRRVYDQLEKYSSAKLIITQNIQCAFVAAAMDTPVVYINSSDISGKIPTFEGHHDTRIYPEIFHVVNINRIQNNQTTTSFKFSNIRGNPNASLLMRLRATAWNVIRKRVSLHETALRFGVVPFARPTSKSVTNLIFHLIFTTSGKTNVRLFASHKNKTTVNGVFAWRHWRCVEAIFYHHPFARVIIHSNTLFQSTFDVLTEAGYDIQVKAYSLADMAKNTSAEVFLRDKFEEAKKGPHWYSHETDLLRLLVLFKWGGIYMDTDIHTVRPLSDLPWNVLGWESGGTLNGAFLKFEKGHPFLEACIQEFTYHYSSSWAANGPLLLTRVWRKLNSTNSENRVHDFPRHAFYMFFYSAVASQCFEETSGSRFDSNKKVLANEAYVVHLNSKMTGAYGTNKMIKKGTLCKHILNSFCVLCNNVY